LKKNCGIKHIVSKERVRKAIKTILELNAKDSPYGITGAVSPDGERDAGNLHAANILVGINYSFLSLAIYEGFNKEAEEIGKRIWSNISEKEKNVWNQPDLCSSSKGEYLFGDHYMRNLCVWSVLFALAKKDKRIAGFLNKFKKEASPDKKETSKSKAK